MNTKHLDIVGERKAGVRAKAAAMGVDEAYVSELVNAFLQPHPGRSAPRADFR